ncbi:MAG: response regulator transcription factor [Pirellula sp.]|jgi:DNA-binding response OmpR family regulator|nr:response regulator transcription factor [Pirellula sp.]
MTNRRRILVIEDDAAIRRAVVDALKVSGFEVDQADRGELGWELAQRGEADLILLDLVLPRGDGWSVLRRLRGSHSTVPIIIMTACGREADRVDGLREGADDYVVKPFSVKELLARIEAVLRRSPQRPMVVSTIEYRFGTIDFERREILIDGGTREDLSEREATLLQYLVQHRDRAISRDELLQNVWRLKPNGISTRTIDMHIARLREKLGDTGSEPVVVLTVRGKGYMFQGNP